MLGNEAYAGRVGDVERLRAPVQCAQDMAGVDGILDTSSECRSLDGIGILDRLTIQPWTLDQVVDVEQHNSVSRASLDQNTS